MKLANSCQIKATLDGLKKEKSCTMLAVKRRAKVTDKTTGEIYNYEKYRCSS